MMIDQSDIIAKMQNISFRYPEMGNWILNQFNLEIKYGEHIGIIGDNGVGKTTIAKLLLGLLQPNQGNVYIAGEIASWRTHVPWLGYIGDPSYLEGSMALPNNLQIEQLLQTYRVFFQESKLALPYEKRLMDSLGLSNKFFCKKWIGDLSKGERQKLMVFLAMAKGPDLLIADEATEGLDRDSQLSVIQQIKEMADDRSMAILWISHRYEEIAIVSQKVYQLIEGRLTSTLSEGFDCSLKINQINQDYQGLPPMSVLNVLAQAVCNRNTSQLQFTATKCNEKNS